jgi:hypothetical protein
MGKNGIGEPVARRVHHPMQQHCGRTRTIGLHVECRHAVTVDGNNLLTNHGRSSRSTRTHDGACCTEHKRQRVLVLAWRSEFAERAPISLLVTQLRCWREQDVLVASDLQHLPACARSRARGERGAFDGGFGGMGWAGADAVHVAGQCSVQEVGGYAQRFSGGRAARRATAGRLWHAAHYRSPVARSS